MRLLLPGTLAVGLWLATAFAFGQAAEPPAVVVVSVAGYGADPDASRLRAAIGTELSVEVVEPADPRAATARGRFDVTIDRAAREVVVAYEGGAQPIVRRVPLDGDAAELTRTIVALAGNLGRDEADELAATIRKARPPEPAAVAPSANAAASAESVREEETLMRLLAEDAHHARTVRIAGSVALLTLGASALATTALYPRGPEGQRVSSIVSPLALPLVFVGVFGVPFADTGLGLTRTSRLERLSAYYGPESETGRPWLRAQVEQMWAKEARESHRHRGIFWAALGYASLVSAGEAGFLLATGDYRDRSVMSVDVAAVGVAAGLGAGFATLAILGVRSDSSTEAGLHGYERAVGHPVVEQVEAAFGPVRGGGVLNLSGRF